MLRKSLWTLSALTAVVSAGATTSADDPVVIHITGPGVNAKYIREGDTEQKDVTVKVGQTVRWSNDKGTNKSHTASATKKDAADKRVFDTGSIAVGDSKDVVMSKAVFDAAGGTPGGSVDLEYICTIHGANNMKSKIVLRDAGASPLSLSTEDVERVRVAKIVNVSLSEEEINPPNLLVTATGEVPTGGYTNVCLSRAVYIVPPADGIQDYFLDATPPTGPASQIVSHVRATNRYKGFTKAAPWLKGVRVHGVGNGVMVKMLGR